MVDVKGGAPVDHHGTPATMPGQIRAAQGDAKRYMGQLLTENLDPSSVDTEGRGTGRALPWYVSPERRPLPGMGGKGTMA